MLTNEMLIKAIDNQAKSVKTKSLDISFNELLDMYNNQELIISPDYQRMFRWSEEKQSMFIESLILEMPLPPIFVIENGEGSYELIDGLQRISTYLHFRYKDIAESVRQDFSSDRIKSELVLVGCDIVKELNEYTFDDLPRVVQLKLKRNFIRMEVLRKETDTNLRYHMFKRLNTGGEVLSAQEIRNCTIRLLGSKGIDFLEECSKNEDFKSVINRIASDKRKTKYDQELVLRFFAIKNDIEKYRYPVTEYLTRYLEKITTEEICFEYQKEKNIFEQTFKFINEHWGEEAFSGRTANGTIKNEFVLYYFDGIAISIASLIEQIISYDCANTIIEAINQIKYGAELQSYKTGSVNGVKTRIRLFTEGVSKILDGR